MPSFIQRTVDWRQVEPGPPEVVMVDQTRLPAEFVLVSYRDYREVARAIKDMVVRGAPAIGAAAALGVALGAYQTEASSAQEYRAHADRVAQELRQTRPTAVNLFWAIDRMTAAAEESLAAPFDLARVRQRVRREALAVLDDDERACRALGAHGAPLVPDGARILTHCNAGALACVAYGTALGVVRAAVEQGKRVAVYADETRPRLQGMKLTAWELMRDGIDVTILSDNAAGYLMSLGGVDCVIVGADRIAANGDVANKIGTYSAAVLAHAHSIPFYVAAPLSTVDFTANTGAVIPIEQRDPDEVTRIGSVRIAPQGAKALNYAFDVTPARLITAIVTDAGVARPPFEKSLRAMRQPRLRARRSE